MIKTLRKTFKQDKEGFEIPKGVQDIVPIIFMHDPFPPPLN